MLHFLIEFEFALPLNDTGIQMNMGKVNNQGGHDDNDDADEEEVLGEGLTF